MYQNLELVQTNAKEINDIVKNWCEIDSDVFKTRDKNTNFSAKNLEEKQSYLYFI